MIPSMNASPSRVIDLNVALDTIQNLLKQNGLNESTEVIYEALIKSLTVHEIDGNPFVRFDDMRGFLLNCEKMFRTGDPSFLRQDRGLCVDRIVDIMEFVESSQFMGQAGYVRPAIRKKLIELHSEDRYIEVLLTGAIGIGKNYFADMSFAYDLYKLSCYHNPQIEYDLAPGSSIMLIMQSISLSLAKKDIFEQFKARIEMSPYFKRNFMFDPNVKSELRFPKNIYVIPCGGNDTAAIGMNVYGGIIDELNFMAKTKDSVRVALTREEEFDQAERLYNTLIKRMKSRFIQKDKIPGKLYLVSSVNYPGDFTDRKMEEAENDPTIFVMKMAQWESLPESRFTDERFPVEIGNDVKRSRILKDSSEAQDEEDVVWIPVTYKKEFERDLETALRDLAGIATGAKHPFIPQRELIEAAQVEHETIFEGRQLFRVSDIVLTDILDPESPDWEQIIDYDYLEDLLPDRTVAFASHLDVGLRQDAAGLAIGRISGYRLLQNVQVFDEKTSELMEFNDINAPIYTIDGSLRILAPKNDEVDLNLVRDLILHIRSLLFLKWCTMDSYQSAMLIQAFRKAKIRSGTLSVDASIAPYTELKLSIKDSRFLCPRHETLATEIRNLERDPEKDKVDHPAGGSKDVSDACAGTVYMLHKKEARYKRSNRRDRSSRAGARSGRQVRKVRIRRRA